MRNVAHQVGRWVQTHKQRSVIILLMATFMMVLIFSFSSSISAELPRERVEYKVVLDAGSTGTRIHVFEFVIFTSDPKPVLRNYPLFVKQEGGLSDFASDPEKCQIGISQLLDQAKQVIPDHLWEETDVLLMATAGLRLLPEDQADLLLESAKSVLNSSPFKVRTVDIIDGKSEAKYIYMMASFVAGSPRMAIVDLGGGSVQLAYKSEQDPKSEYEKKFLDSSSKMYLNSWLGFGLVAFRMKALEKAAENAHPCVPQWTPEGTTYQYAGKTHPVVPRIGDDLEMHACIELVKHAIVGDTTSAETCSATLSSYFSKNIRGSSDICGLNDEYIGPVAQIPDWRLFSYIFDLAKEEGLVKPDQHEASLTPTDFFNSAKAHCTRNSSANTEWWKCVDLVYVGVLLTEGFGLSEQSQVKVTKKLIYRDRLELEAAWPLGAALEALTARI